MNRAAAPYLVAASLLFANGARAAAQELPVSRLLPEIIKLSAVVGQGETGDHRQHFVPGLVGSATAIAEINRAILFQAAAFPQAPMSTVVSTRDAVPALRLFGAGYTDTAFVLGSKRLLFTMSYESMTFATIDKLDLRDSSFTFYIPHAAATGDQSDRDMMQQIASLRLNRKTATFSLARGWGGRFDVRVAVPIVQMAADVRVVTHIIRTASAQTPAVHEFDVIDRASQTFARFCAVDESTTAIECGGNSTAQGVGDIVFRGKVALSQGSSPLAFSLDARLPTGNADEMIGLGATQLKPALVWSLDAGRMGARLRADYTWSQGNLSSRLAEDAASLDLDVPDELGLGIGIDADVAPRTTFAFDLLGRRIRQVRQFSRGTAVFTSRGPGLLPSASFVADDVLLVGDTRDLTQVMATLGVQFDVPGGFLAQVRALVPVSGGGLRPQVTALFALTKRY